MYRKILVPLDGSELAEHALKHAQTIMGKDPKVALILLRVMEPLLPVPYYMPGDAEYWADAMKKADQDAEEYLTKIADNLKEEGVANIRNVILKGQPGEQILNYLATTKIDLVIMTTHGRSGISRWLMGSVAERVMRHSSVPVLIVPPPGSRGSRKRVLPPSERRSSS
jgi:nucleotide-binding universal stress UspA family protein